MSVDLPSEARVYVQISIDVTSSRTALGEGEGPSYGRIAIEDIKLDLDPGCTIEPVDEDIHREATTTGPLEVAESGAFIKLVTSKPQLKLEIINIG